MSVVTFLAWVTVGATAWAAVLAPVHFWLQWAGRRRASSAVRQRRRIERHVLRRL